MDGLRFLFYFVHNASGPNGIASELRQLEFSQRPGMHQPIEDGDELFFAQADREFLSQMGICAEISGAQNGGFHNAKTNMRENAVVSISAQDGFPHRKLPI